MLARNFMTHQELGTSKEVYGALVTLLGMLERGEVHYLETITDKDVVGDLRHINMHYWRCGTVGCMGGWVEHLADLEEDVLRKDLDVRNPALWQLFFPMMKEGRYAGDKPLSKITTDDMRQALHNYLSLGDSRWEEVLEP